MTDVHLDWLGILIHSSTFRLFLLLLLRGRLLKWLVFLILHTALPNSDDCTFLDTASTAEVFFPGMDSKLTS